MAGHFPFGSRVFGILWKLTIITATLAICACLVYLWTVVLAVSILKYLIDRLVIISKQKFVFVFCFLVSTNF